VPDYANVVVKVVAIFGVICRVLATTPAHNVFCYSAVAHILTHWCRRRGAGSASTPPKALIWCKSRENTSKSGQNLWKPSQTPWTYEQKWHPTSFDLKKLAPNFRGSLWEFGLKSFALPKICLLHLCRNSLA